MDVHGPGSLLTPCLPSPLPPIPPSPFPLGLLPAQFSRPPGTALRVSARTIDAAPLPQSMGRHRHTLRTRVPKGAGPSDNANNAACPNNCMPNIPNSYPQSSRRAPRLFQSCLRSCPETVEDLPREPRAAVHSGGGLAKVWPVSAERDQCWAKLGRVSAAGAAFRQLWGAFLGNFWKPSELAGIAGGNLSRCVAACAFVATGSCA